MSYPVTVGVVFYGDHPALAARCLGPLLPLAATGAVQLRVGCNECGPRTLAYLAAGGVWESPHVGLVVSPDNIHKYPMMRRLIGLGPLAPQFMWFDDDSYIDAPDPAAWLAKALAVCEPGTAVGQVWSHALGGNQNRWVEAQPWYAGKPVRAGQRVFFLQGAWWVVPAEILYRHDWPAPALERKGGDVMFGELCRQQGYRLRDVGRDFGVRINADAAGRHSKSQTRGPMPLPRPIGWDYRPAG